MPTEHPELPDELDPDDPELLEAGGLVAGGAVVGGV